MSDNFVEIGWQIQYVILFWVAIGCMILFAGSLAWFNRYDFVSNRGGIVAMVTAIFSGIGLVSIPVLCGYALIVGPDLMKDYKVEGKVLSVTNSFKNGNGDLTNLSSPVVSIEGVDTPLFVKDGRILTLVGKPVTLRCNGEWRYHADARYLCEIMSFPQNKM